MKTCQPSLPSQHNPTTKISQWCRVGQHASRCPKQWANVSLLHDSAWPGGGPVEALTTGLNTSPGTTKCEGQACRQYRVKSLTQYSCHTNSCLTLWAKAFRISSRSQNVLFIKMLKMIAHAYFRVSRARGRVPRQLDTRDRSEVSKGLAGFSVVVSRDVLDPQNIILPLPLDTPDRSRMSSRLGRVPSSLGTPRPAWERANFKCPRVSLTVACT